MSSADRLPEFFPRAPKACLEVSQEFFTCFSENTIPFISDPEKNKGTSPQFMHDALKTCESQRKKYEECVRKVEETNPSKRFRVPEEYRRLQKSLMDD